MTSSEAMINVPPTMRSAPLLVVVEGTNDIEFLRRISCLLHQSDSTFPQLKQLEQQGELVFLPCGGGQVSSWSHRLAPLGKREFHLYDRELPPETDKRLAAVQSINVRQGCRAVITQKRNLENYLHPQAIFMAGGIEVEFGDFDQVGEVVAQVLYRQEADATPWQLLSRRTRSRLTQRGKRWLNTEVAQQMTTELLRDRDPIEEVASWLKTIDQLTS